MYDNKFCIVRGEASGLFFARVASLDWRKAELEEARCLWWWEGANDPTQLAMEGTKKPDACSFSCIVPMMTLTDVIEVIPCTDAAAASIQAVKVWKA